eukprot:2582309-Amphidinium_carterae.1
MLDWTFATFAEVQRQKQWFKKRRGFEDKGKGKGKRKDQGKDYSGYPSNYLPKGKGKSGWRNENFQRFQHRRYERDDRRAQKGFVRTTRDQVLQRVKCWRCQQVGHMAAQCTNPTINNNSNGGKGTYGK